MERAENADRPRRMGGGLSADIYEAGDGRCLKVFKPRFYDYADMEYRKTLLAGRLGISVPEMVRLTVTEEGNPAIEMERLPDTDMSGYLKKYPAKCPVILLRLARLVVRLESIPYAYPGEEAAFAAEYLDKKRYTGSLVRKIAQLQGVLPEEFERIRRFYDSIPESGNFVHGDIGPPNVFVSENGRHLRLIDFGLSGFGSWLFDFTTMYEKYYDPMPGKRKWFGAMVMRHVYRYYLWLSLRAGKRGGIRNMRVILDTLGAMVNINRLTACVTFRPETGADAVRSYVRKALRCIDRLPDGVCPPGL